MENSSTPNPSPLLPHSEEYTPMHWTAPVWCYWVIEAYQSKISKYWLGIKISLSALWLSQLKRERNYWVQTVLAICVKNCRPSLQLFLRSAVLTDVQTGLERPSSGRDHITDQSGHWVTTVHRRQKVKEMVGLYKHIVSSNKYECWLVNTTLTDPLVTHDVCVGRVLGTVHEVSLNNVIVQITFK